jgi:hypothetical protein
MAEQKNYQDHQLGFDRTQLYKEWIQPQINRSTALRSTIEYCTINGIELNVKLTMLMTQRFVEYLETGDTSWMDKMESYLEDKKLKQVQCLNQ